MTLGKLLRILFSVLMFYFFMFALAVHTTHCQELPNSPEPAFKVNRTMDKKFWTLTLVNAASATSDAWTTHQGIKAGYYEANPIMGDRPGLARITVTAIGVTAFQTYLGYYAKKKCDSGADRMWCYLWPIPQSVSISVHMVGTIHNYRMVH